MDTSNFHIGAGSLSIGGVDVGATTQDGVIVTYEPQLHEHHSGKYGMTPVKTSLIGVKLSLVVTIAESTLANLNKALAGSHLVGSKVQLGGVAGTEVVGAIVVLTPFDGTQAWTFKNAVSTGSVEVAYQVENERVYKVTFSAQVDTSSADNENLAKVS